MRERYNVAKLNLAEIFPTNTDLKRVGHEPMGERTGNVR